MQNLRPHPRLTESEASSSKTPQVIHMHIIKFEMHWNTEFPKGKCVEFGRLSLLYVGHWGGCAPQTVGNVVLKPLRKRTQEEMSIFTKMLIVVGAGAWWGHQWREEDRIGGRGGVPIWLREKGSWVKEEKDWWRMLTEVRAGNRVKKGVTKSIRVQKSQET